MKKSGSNTTETPRGPGRPTLPESVSRQHRVITFATTAEKTMLEEMAGDDSISLSAVFHKLITKGLRDHFEAQRLNKPRGDIS